MSYRLRHFLLYLLIVSLPMQSIAGVARFECGMSHHPLIVDGAVHGELSMHGTMSRAAHEDEHEHEHTGVAEQGSSSDDADCEGTDAQARSACGTCADCYIGAFGPPPGVALTVLNEAAWGVQQIPSSSFIGHIPARIERPPRATSAIAS